MSLEHEITGGPWPERLGLRCEIVTQPRGPVGSRYPWHGLADGEVVVFIPNDPITRRPDDYWTCVLGRRHVSRVPPIEWEWAKQKSTPLVLRDEGAS